MLGSNIGTIYRDHILESFIGVICRYRILGSDIGTTYWASIGIKYWGHMLGKNQVGQKSNLGIRDKDQILGIYWDHILGIHWDHILRLDIGITYWAYIGITY